MEKLSRTPIYVRDDFRRDGLAATFKISMNLYQKYLESFPSGTRINIGYPSICKQEYLACKEILKLRRTEVELSPVGHARQYDLKIMEELLRGHSNVSANIWIPLSDSACSSILNSTPEDVLKAAMDSIKYWKRLTDIPLDIALTDTTNIEEYLDNRIADWYSSLMSAGFRSIILCDTQGVGNIERLSSVFKQIGDFEWHPHDDGGFAKTTSELAVKFGASHIGTSFLKCSERMNMLDPRSVIEDERFNELLDHIVGDFKSEVTEIIKLRDTIYNKNTFITGTHHKLWGKTGADYTLLFGVTTDSQLFKLITGKSISSECIAELKDKYLYSDQNSYMTKEKLLKLDF
ncbi:hypothetical protein [Ekhidna sp.]|uniref:hypothetical protein n=1 Tax=Ekhidna sp. TaxID=2608089 RepID=UPI003296D44C